MKSGRLKQILLTCLFCFVIIYLIKAHIENQALKKIIERLCADSRVAEAVVTEVRFDPAAKKNYTTIKFLEYDTKLRPLAPKYFTFSENIIQFQALVLRFDDFYIKKGDPLKGKSAYIFMKAFALKDKAAEVFEINRINDVPSGYRIEGVKTAFERQLWQRFWRYALEPGSAKKLGIKNAQIEAPGTKFVPGILYTIKIEHDGGLRIDTQPLPAVLKGERFFQ